MPVHPYVLASIPSVLLVLCAVAFFRRTDREGVVGFARAVGFLSLCSLPAGLLQPLGLAVITSEPFALVLAPLS